MLLGGIVILDAVRLGFGWGPDGPQSGFFPFWLALIMVFCCALVLLQAVRGNVSKSFVSRKQLDSVLKVLWPAVAAVALMHFIGLYVASPLYIGFYMRWVGRQLLGFPSSLLPSAFLLLPSWFSRNGFSCRCPKGH